MTTIKTLGREIMKNVIVILATVLMSASALAAITEDGSYALDKDHAHVGFSVTHLGISKTVGRFNSFDGSFELVSGGDSTVNFTIEVDSIDTNQKRRDKHLKSNDFFNARQFKNIVFNSTSVTYDENGDPASVVGDLQMLGNTNTITFDVKPVGSGLGPNQNKRAGYEATAVLQRSEFGMTKFAGVVGEDVTVSVNIELIKK